MRTGLGVLLAGIVLAMPASPVPAADACSASSAYSHAVPRANLVVRVTCPFALQDTGPDKAITLKFNRTADDHGARLSGAGRLRCATDARRIDCVGSVTDPGETASIFATITPSPCTKTASLTIALTIHTADGRTLGPQAVAPPKRCVVPPPPHKPTKLRVTWVHLAGGPRVVPTVSFSIGAPTQVGVSMHHAGGTHPEVGRIVRCKRKGRCKVTLPSIEPGHWVAEARGGGYVVKKTVRIS